jgi:Tfp pilus assembly protein PilV
MRNKENGFTLLEVLLATFLFTTGIVAVVRVFSMGLVASSDIENVDLALNIAQKKMEEIKNTPFANLADSGPAAADTTFPLSNFSITVDVAELQNPMPVNVAVNWNVSGGTTGVNLVTLVTNY